MAQYGFGAGYLTLVDPATVNATPIQLGVLRDVSLDISFSNKELRGAYQFPVDIARGAGKVSGKAKYAQINGTALAAILNVTPATPGYAGIDNEQGTIPTTPFQVTAAQGAQFFKDLGVINLATGVAMTRGATSTGTGVYAVNETTGVYTFNTADTGVKVALRYDYKIPALKSSTLANALMGSSLVFAIYWENVFRAKNTRFMLPAVSIPKLAMSFKPEDYTETDMDFDAYADTSGNVLTWHSTE